MKRSWPLVGLAALLLALAASAAQSRPSANANPGADFSVAKTESKDPAVVGEKLTYTVTARNNGPDPGVVDVADRIPDGVEFVSATVSQGGPCTGPDAQLLIRCPAGTVRAGESVILTVVVKPKKVGKITNFASVFPSPAGSDPNTGNDHTSVDTTVVGGKPCKCVKLTVKPDGTLLNKAPKLRPDKHDFGVGFQWFLTCSKGVGKCTGQVRFRPPEILAGTLPKPKQNLHINIKRALVTCGPTGCNASSAGKFQIKMLSREQLNQLFGRTMAYTVVVTCGGQSRKIQVRVLVDETGKLKLR